MLDAKDSGTPVEPIRLTSDPTWGTGEAYFLGSVRIEGGWAKADATIAPNIPEPEKVYYVDIALPETKMVVEMEGEEFKQLHVARSPNYRWSDDDILTTWWKMTGKVEGNGGLWLTDNNNLVQDNPDYYAGATIFSQEDAIVMCSVWKQEVEEWDPDNNRIKVNDTNFGGNGSYYFIENTPFLLDTVNEFYYDQSAQRLFIRLEGEKDPNTTIIEAATKTQLITIGNKHDIEISGITFGITTDHTVRYGEEGSRSVIRITGLCNNININNNNFYYVNGGISMNSNGSREQNSHSFVVSDNDFQNTGDHAIVFATSGAYIEDVNILRNNVFNSGYRHQGRWYSSIPAIYGQLFYGEIAGNVINYSFGNGLDLFWGKGGGSNAYVPFVRGLIHQNKASHTLIGTNDYGGIESWQGGPTYCYNNYSHDGGGYKHYNNSSIGYAYYFDGSFKHFVFNNIASGVSHNRNSAAIMQVLNYHNMFVHNTAYNTDKFFNAWKGALALNGHNMYLANVAHDVNFFFKHEIAPEYIPFESYGYNVSSGSSFKATLESLDKSLNLSQFRNKLEEYESQLTITGVNATSDVLSDPAAKAFDLNTNTEAIGRGVKFFTAFPLARVVGEWNFYKHPADTNLVMAENLYMTEDYSNRNTYEDVPMNHLNVFGISDTSFIHGDLEDWTTGALQFDGVRTYGMVEHATFSDVQSANLDITTSNFILEVYFKTIAAQTGGILINKHDGSTGYSLAINDAGMAELTLSAGGSAILAATATPVNDDQWHHLLLEVDRYSGITLFLDGDASEGAITGEMPATDVSFSTTADFYVGRNGDGNYFNGVVDFLRVSKGSLYEARTTIDELYTWQTDGPFLYDMLGNPPVGKRDAGAIESESTCDMSVSATELHFETEASSQEIKVVSTDVIYLRDVTADFISVELKTDTVVVSVTENTIAEIRSGSFTVVSCNQTSKVKVTQAAAPCSFECDVDTLKVDHTAQAAEIEVSTNSSLALNVPQEAFLSGQVNETGTLVTLQINANTVLEERSTEIDIVHCNGTHTVTIVQEAVPCQFIAETDSINVNFESHTVEVALQSNAELIVDYPMGSFITASLNEAQDALTVAIEANATVTPREAEIIIYNCGDNYTIYVTQEAVPESVPAWDGGEVVIYPNPNAGGNFRVEVPTSAMGAMYVISDISGKAMHDGFLRQTDSEFSLDAAPGMYIFEIRKDNTVYRSKFMVTEKL